MYTRIHRYLAGGIFLVSLTLYTKTMAPTVSFWDCGEFIASAITLGVPHPPGAPLYLLVGKIFSMLPLGADLAFRVNLVSALSSALTILFLYLITVRFLKEFITDDGTWN